MSTDGRVFTAATALSAPKSRLVIAAANAWAAQRTVRGLEEGPPAQDSAGIVADIA